MRTLAAALALLAVMVPQAAGAQTVRPEASEIGFVTRQMGVPVEGRFRRWSAQLAFDPRQPQAARVEFTIETASVAFGAAETEAEAGRREWFDSARFPQALFRSQAVRALGGARYEIAGTLTIKGRSREVVVPVTLTRPADGSGQGLAQGSFTLRRLDFALGDAEWRDTSLVADEVQVRLRLALSGLAPP